MSKNWHRYSASGTKALQSKDLDTAESMWLAAMEEANDFDLTDPRLAHTLESLAEIYYRRGNLDLAGRYCQRVLDLCEKTLGVDHPDVGVLAHNLAMLHHMQCQFNQAEPLYKKAMTIRTKALGGKHPEVLRLLEGYSDLLDKMHRGEEANHLRQCIDGVTTGRWTRSGRWSIFSSAAANVPDPATTAPRAAASTAAQSHTTTGEHPTTHSTISRIRSHNESHVVQGPNATPSQANQPAPTNAFNRALQSTTVPPKSPAAAVPDKAALSATEAHRDAAVLDAQSHRDAQSQSIPPTLRLPQEPKRAGSTARADEKRNDSGPLKMASEPKRPAPMNKAEITRPLPKMNAEEPVVAQQKEEPKPATMNQPPQTLEQSEENWRLYRNFAEQAQSSGNLTVAEQLWRQALREAECFGLDPRLAYTLDSLADSLARQRDYPEAEKYLRRALDMKVSAVGRDHIAVAFTTSSLAKLYYWKGDYKQAVLHGKECVRIYETACGPEHLDTACALYNLALIFHFKDNYDEAEKAYKRALVIRQRTLGDQHPDTIKVQTNYAKLLHLKQKDRSKDVALISGTWRVLELPPDAQLWLNDVD